MFDNSANKFLFSLIKEKPIYIFTCLVSASSISFFKILETVVLILILVFTFGGNLTTENNQTTSIIQQGLVFFGSFGNYPLLNMTISLLLLVILKNLSSYCTQVFELKYVKYLVFQMKSRGLDILSQVDIDYYHKNKTGDILFKFEREIERSASVIKNINKILFTSINIFIFVFVLMLISWQLTFFAFLLMTIMAFTSYFLINCAKKIDILLAQKSKLYNHKLIEFITGIQYIKTVTNEVAESKKISQLIQEKDRTEQKAKLTLALLNPVNDLTGAIAILCLSIFSYYLYGEQIQALAPVLVLYLVILFNLQHLVTQLNNAVTHFINSKFSLGIVANFLTEANKPMMKSGNTILSTLKVGIEFQNVTFAYPNHAEIVLDKINLSIPQGKTIAILGASGSGKSTLINLLSRFYEPMEGSILIDHQHIQEYNLTSLRQSIGIVNQNPFLFDKSIAENLTYGLKNVNLTDLVTAAQKTQAYNFIEQLPEKFNTKIGDRGVTLSEVQKQLIAITRVFLRNPAIVIVDEPTIILDKAGVKLIQAAIEELCRDRTNIIITQRLDTIQKAAQIIVLNKGKIIEAGTHEQLLKTGNLYKRLYANQFKSNQQSHQQLAQKIAQKLAYQNNNNFSAEIRSNLNSLLNYLQLLNQDKSENGQEQEKILDQSYQSAKNMLASLKEYERKISHSWKNNS